jgi:predicted DNA-binding transcriptional regulator AlpA
MPDKTKIEDITLVDLKEVAQAVGRSPATVKNWAAAGIFPKPLQATPRGKMQWRLTTIKAWLDKRQRRRYVPPTARGALLKRKARADD